MSRTLLLLLLPGLLGGLCSCSRVGRLLEPDGPVDTSIPEVPPQFRGRNTGPVDPTTRVTLETPQDVTPENVGRVRARERDLVWTDPDNPETELQGLEEVMAEAKKRGPWMVSFTEARRAAMREGKPLVIWFTNSLPGRSPVCKLLGAEVFSKKEFGEWAEENVVRLRLDFNVEGESGGPYESAMDDKVRKLNYLEKLKQRYKVLGLPAVLVLSPDGTVISHHRGFTRTYGDFYFRRMRNEVAAALKQHEEWKATMARRGYREWTDTQGRTVFAKLARYSDGEMILAEPDGKLLRTREGSLSKADRAWIAAEKSKRDR